MDILLWGLRGIPLFYVLVFFFVFLCISIFIDFYINRHIMEFITKSNQEKNIYSIPNNVNNKYIIEFLSQYISVNIINDNILFETESIISFNKKNITDYHIEKFIYDTGAQILLLKKYKFGIKYIDLSDIVIINSNIFL